jgi:Peptidase MA superfamily
MMVSFAARPIGRRLVVALVSALLALSCLAGPAAGASTITFGPGTAVSTFGQEIQFTQPYTGTGIQSASILIKTPDQYGPAVVALTSLGTGFLVFKMDTSSGGLYPFDPVTAYFEAVLADGSTVDGPPIKVVYADDRFTWKTLAGSVVTLHYIQAADSFAQQMVNEADAGATKAAALFGVSETRPIDYYVYPSQTAFQQGLSEPGTIGGVAVPSFRSCFAVVGPTDASYAAEVMPHEVTHVVFADATDNPYHDPPRWLNEGFADYVAIGYDATSRQLVSEAARGGTLPSLLALMDYFPLDADRIYLAYAEAVGAVDFMVRTYGQPAILKLVKAYAGGASDDEAFTAALGVSVAAFDSAWLAANGVTAHKYGPQAAATGPLPPGWNGSTAGPTVAPQSTPENQPGASGAVSPVGDQAPGRSDDSTALLLAAVIAGLGLVLMGTALALMADQRRGWL